MGQEVPQKRHPCLKSGSRQILVGDPTPFYFKGIDFLEGQRPVVNWSDQRLRYGRGSVERVTKSR